VATNNSVIMDFMLRLTTRLLIGCALVWAGTASAQTNDFAARAEKIFLQARVLAQDQPTNSARSIRLARVSFEWAEYSRDDNQRESIAHIGIAAARAVLAREETNAAAHYWLGMNLGQLARTKTLGALKLVREMESEFHRARALDPHTDFAGPDRSLARLYRDAPGWPASIGDRKKAREHFENAARLHPEFPDNQLHLLEWFAESEDHAAFQRQRPVAEKTLEEARKKFIGADWDSSWADWNSRMEKMRQFGGRLESKTARP
jgi:tetratricopeptide (TPR) repeat protein